MLEIEDSFDQINSIDFLMNRVVDCNVNATDHDGYTALHYAVQNCSIRAITTLLKNGADVHLRTKEHKLTALHFAVKKEYNLSVVKCLVNSGAIVESINCEEEEEVTPLQMSLFGGSKDVIEYLIDNGADVNRLETNLQFTTLHLSIYQRRYDLFQLLIHRGADVNISGEDGLTPLHLSSMLGHSDFTESLIRLGAEVNCLYHERLTPLHLAALKSLHIDNSKFMREDSIRSGHENSLIVKLLMDSHDSIERQDYEGVIDILVCNGADINALTPDGQSPLHLALQSNFLDTLRALLARGAELNCKLGTRCLYTLFYVCVRNNDDITMKNHLDRQTTTLMLIRAIDALEDNDIKRAVICLCAIVDAGNVDGCMPVNVEIKNDYIASSNSFRTNRVNVNDSEVYSKFACDRVLSGALQRVTYGNIESRKLQYIYDYLSMLNAVELPLTSTCITYSRTQSIADMYASDKVKTYFNSCLDEVDKMKCYLIDNCDSLYEVLHMRLKRRRFRTKKLNLNEIELEFPIYCKLILARYREDVVRKVLMDSVQLALNQLIGLEIPIICVEEIFADLGIMNMIATIEAAGMI